MRDTRTLRHAAGSAAARAAAAALLLLAALGGLARPAAAQVAFASSYRPSKCITAPDSALQVPGGELWLVPCDGRPSQSILPDGSRHLVLFGGQRDRHGSLLCAAHPGPAAQWVRLRALPCEEDAQAQSPQNWTPESSGLLRGDFGWCIATDGSQVYLLGCNAANHRATWTTTASRAAPAPPPATTRPTAPLVFGAFSSRANGSKCIAVDGGRLELGTPLILWRCDRTPSQLLALRSDGRLVASGGQTYRDGRLLCVDTRVGARNGSPVHVFPCNDGVQDDAQGWTRTPQGQFRSQQSGKCLDIRGGNAMADTDGVPLVLWDCDGFESKHWDPWPAPAPAPAPAPEPAPTPTPVPAPTPTPPSGSGCRDPWITQAYLDLVGRKPQGSGDRGECDPRLYGDGHWSDYADLKVKITWFRSRTSNGFNPNPLPVCDDPWITRAVRTVSQETRYTEEVRGSGTIGECNPNLYGNRWSSEGELLGYVRETFRQLKAHQLEFRPGGRLYGDLRYNEDLVAPDYVGPAARAPQRNWVIPLPNGYVLAIQRRCSPGYQWDYSGCLVPEYRP